MAKLPISDERMKELEAEVVELRALVKDLQDRIDELEGAPTQLRVVGNMSDVVSRSINSEPAPELGASGRQRAIVTAKSGRSDGGGA